MKRYLSTLQVLLLAGVLVVSGCSSDDYMSKLNTDPSKAATIDPSAQLTTAELQTYGDLDATETVRSYLYAFTQQLMGCWNTTNYGGRHTADDNEMTHIWKTFYANAVKNLTDAEYRTHGDALKTNINAVVRIYRTYIMSILTDLHGDVPYFEAGQGYINGTTTPRFDRQEDIYKDFFAQLDTAVAQFDVTKDEITGDVIYHGDVAKWVRLANSLRMRFAMRVSDVAPELAKQEFLKAVQADGGYLTTGDDDALIHYMQVAFSFGSEAYQDFRANRTSQRLFGNDPSNNPSYICSTFFYQLLNSGDPRTYQLCRFYCDDLMSATAPDNRIDLTNEVLAKHVTPQPRDPGAFAWEPWPTAYISDTLTLLKEKHPEIVVDKAYNTEPKMATNFLQADNPGVVMTAAEVRFLLAEAQVKGWNVSSQTANDLYKQGIRLSMDFLTHNYGCEAVSDAAFQDFVSRNEIGHTAEKMKEAINTQAWILHFTNPYEAWANLRRSGYPRLKSPAEYGFSKALTDGQEIPVRLCYPVLTASYNKANYDEALQRMGGTDSWYARVWWDVK